MEENKLEKLLGEKGVRGAPVRRSGGASMSESKPVQDEQEFALRVEQKSVRGRPVQEGGVAGSDAQADLKNQKSPSQLEQRAVRALPTQRGGVSEPKNIQK
ncbi:MAG: hypothetical protein WC913_07255 [Desulfuromonas sp.]